MKLMFYTLQYVESCRISSICELFVKYKRLRIEKALISIGKNLYLFVALYFMLLYMIFYQLHDISSYKPSSRCTAIYKLN